MISASEPDSVMEETYNLSLRERVNWKERKLKFATKKECWRRYVMTQKLSASFQKSIVVHTPSISSIILWLV